MPMQSSKSGLLGKYGDKLKKAAEAHKDDPVEYGNMGLPAGIEGGVAQLNECKFTQIKAGKQNAGEYVFYASGIVMSPEIHNGVGIKGLRTQISEPVYDTPTRSRKTIDEHVKWIQNIMKQLGAGPESLGAEDLETTAAALKEAAPCFRFRTWKGAVATEGQYKGKEPMVNHQWNGICECTDEADETAGVTEPAAATATAPPPPAAAPEAQAPATDPIAELEALAELADGGDTDSMEDLKAKALAAGLTEEFIATGAATWAAVVEAIKAGGASPEWKPAKEEHYKYLPKGATRPVDVEVTTVNENAKTCSLLSQVDKKTIYKGVKWSELIRG